MLGSKIRRALYGAFMLQKWTIGLSAPPIHVDSSWFAKGRILRPLPGADFLADPFLVPGTFGRSVLCEWMKSDLGRGVIAKVDIDDGDEIVDIKVVIDRAPYHLSYPYLVQHEGQLYCCPESCHSRSVRLYRLTPRADRVEEEREVISDFAAVDPTLFMHDGRWWLLCTNARDGRSNSDLYAFHSAGLFGPWIQHDANPIVKDLGTARPAGGVFTVDGVLYRPSQDCSVRYGGGLNLSRIEVLTPSDYRETRVWTLHAPQGFRARHGIHTVNAVDDAVVFDAYSEQFNPIAWWYRWREIRQQRQSKG